jgi:hypothetical protein
MPSCNGKLPIKSKAKGKRALVVILPKNIHLPKAV